jgi:protocatechuate 3,4-dioxygenase beta subunit
MHRHLPRYLVLSILSILLTACGGGGGGGDGAPVIGGGTGTGGGGATAGTPTLTVSILDGAGVATSNVTGNTPVTIRAVLLDGAGDPVANTVVNFSSTVGQLTPATGNVLTGSDGVATISLGAGTIQDAGTASASAVVDGVTIQATDPQGIQSDGASTGVGSVALTVGFVFTTPDSSVNVTRSNPATATVTVTDTGGSGVQGAIVNFSTTAGVLNPVSGAVSTSAAGVATVTLTAGTTAGSGALSAQITSGAETISADTINFITAGDAFATLTLSVPNGTTTTATAIAAPVTVTATVIDAEGNPVEGAIVQFFKDNTGGSADSGVLSSLIDITNASGIATTNLLPGTVVGPGSITATTTVVGVAVASLANNTITFQSSGDGPFDGVGTSNLNISIALLDGAGTAFVGSIDANSPGVLQATVVDATGTPLANTVIEFATDRADVFPISGLALTNAAGIATVALNAGSNPGAGTATATLIIDGGRFNSDSLTFQTLGNAGDANIVLSLTFTDATPGNGTNIITIEDNATVGILVEDGNGVNLPNRTVTITTSLATAAVGTGTPGATVTAVSDGDGRVNVTLTAGTNFGTGDFVAIVGDSTASVQFTVGIAGLQIGTCSGGTSATDCVTAAATRTGFAPPLGTATNGILSIGVSPLSAGGTSSVAVVVLDATGAPVEDVDIAFTSNCVGINDAATGNPLSSITQTVSSLANGVATATYQDDEGCARSDIITATEASTGETATGTIEVLPAQIGAIVFDSVTFPDGVTVTDTIFIKESGGTSSARVVFQVLDVLGQPASDQTVSFALTSTAGGIVLQNAQGLTDSTGKVAAIVSAGFIATTVRVRASLDVDTDDDGDNTDFATNGAATLVTLSDQLSINTGIADQNSFTLAATRLNFEGNNFDGQTVVLTSFLADRFNNPVSGTSVQYRTEFGTITPSCATAASGSCTATLTSTEPRGPLDTNVSNQNLVDNSCPSSLVVEESATVAGNDVDTQYTASSINRVETTADVLVAATTYTVDSDGSGITCTAAACSGEATLKITYTRSFPDEDANGATTHVITNPGVATAPFRSSVQGAVPCSAASIAQGGSLSSGYLGGLGQGFGARSTVLAFTQGEESFIDSNGNGLYDFNEPFVDLTEAFVDINEDNVFGNGNPATDASRNSTTRTCYGPNSPITLSGQILGNCFQVGGSEEEPIDFNENGKFDNGNGIYNGTLCPLAISDRTDTCDNNADACDEATEQYCTRDLVSINKEAVIIFSGSGSFFSLVDIFSGEFINGVDIRTIAVGSFRANTNVIANDGSTILANTDFQVGNADPQVRPQIGDTVSLTSGTSGVVVQFSDRFNQQLPAGTSIAVASGNGGCTIANNPGTTQLSTNSTALNGVFLSLAAPVNPVTGSAPITITITTPQNVTSLFSFTCTY